MKIVQQPLRSGAEVVAHRGFFSDKGVRFAQSSDVVNQTRRKGGGPVTRCAGSVRLPETVAMLRKALSAENFRANRCQDFAAGRVQHAKQGARGLWHQTLKPGIAHHLQHR